MTSCLDVLAGCRPSGPCDQCRLETSRYRAYPSAMPAAPLPPAPRRFAIRMPRPRGSGVAACTGRGAFSQLSARAE